MEWSDKNDADPSTLTTGSHKQMIWCCSKCGHEWTASVANRIGKQTGCPCCTGKQVVTGKNDLASQYPDVALDWIAEENDGKQADEIYYGTHTKGHFVCHECGHKWSTSVAHRTKGETGCPKCAGKVVPQDELDRRAAERARIDAKKEASCLTISDFWLNGGKEEWSDNNTVDPSALGVGSTKIALWRCKKCGVEWEAPVYARAKKGHNCPYCSGQKVKSGINDLMTKAPEIGKEFDAGDNDVKASEIYWKTTRRGEFVCSTCGHHWSTTVNNRTHAGTGCPMCARKRQAKAKSIAKEGQDLLTLYPDIAKELDKEKSALPAGKIPYASNKDYPWVCPEHGTYWMAPSARTALGHGCPVCAGKVIQIGKNDLGSTHPKVAAQWHPIKNGDLTPEKVTAGSNYKVFWICHDCGHEWQQSVCQRTETNLACPKCRRKHERPEIADPLDETEFWLSGGSAKWSDKNNVDPHDMRATSHHKATWVCPDCGEEWEQAVRRVVQTGGLCPCCHFRKLVKGKNDLLTTHPEIAAEFDAEKNGVEASEVMPNSKKKYWFKCSECGHEWRTSIALRAKKGKGCAKCASKKQGKKRAEAVTGVNDLASKTPELAAELDAALSPKPADKIPYGSGKPYPWVCPKHGTYWLAPSIRQSGRGCPKCGMDRKQQKMIELRGTPILGVNDVESQAPDIAKELDTNLSDKVASEICCGSSKKYPWICTKHGTYWASPASRYYGGTGCPKCCTSHGEKEIERILVSLNIPYGPQYWTRRCVSKHPLRFDFAIYKRTGNALILTGLIEFQGEQHYVAVKHFGGQDGLRARKMRDAIKREWCEREGIPLLEIPYGMANEIDDLIIEFLGECGILM